MVKENRAGAPRRGAARTPRGAEGPFAAMGGGGHTAQPPRHTWGQPGGDPAAPQAPVLILRALAVGRSGTWCHLAPWLRVPGPPPTNPFLPGYFQPVLCAPSPQQLPEFPLFASFLHGAGGQTGSPARRGQLCGPDPSPAAPAATSPTAQGHLPRAGTFSPFASPLLLPPRSSGFGFPRANRRKSSTARAPGRVRGPRGPHPCPARHVWCQPWGHRGRGAAGLGLTSCSQGTNLSPWAVPPPC